jgi:hypothetical protein
MLKLRNIIKGFDFKEKNMRNNLKIRPDIKFYDTEALYKNIDDILNSNEKFLISSSTIDILEFDKALGNSLAYMLLNFINNNTNICEIIEHQKVNKQLFPMANIINIQTLSDAYYANNILYPDEVIFITSHNDLANFANYYFGDSMIQLI